MSPVAILAAGSVGPIPKPRPNGFPLHRGHHGARAGPSGQQFLSEERIDFTAVIPRARFRRAVAPDQPDYWRRMRPELKAVFKGCCAYSRFLLEEALTPVGVDLTASVDHFQPISQSVAILAYEWSNLRWSWKNPR